MASALYKLAGGTKVRWAPEPLLQAGMVLLVIVFVWAVQGGGDDHGRLLANPATGAQVSRTVYRGRRMPTGSNAREDEVDLYMHYDTPASCRSARFPRDLCSTNL